MQGVRCLNWNDVLISRMNDQIESKLAALGTRSADVDERFIRGSGKGGQKINKTSSCVWLRHGPTGVEARCQRERSQLANRELAWADLCAKLQERQRAAAAIVQHEREKDHRRQRPKSRGQKLRMLATKKHRSTIKARRGRPEAE